MEENLTTIYLIRHSVRMNNNEKVDSYKTSQSELIKEEKNILSVDGEIRANILSDELELQNIDVVYASNCVRTLQTAKYMLHKQNLKVNIDERLDERRIGIPNDKEFPNYYTLQFLDENYKTVGGESQKEVRNRMLEVFNEIVDSNKGKRIAVFSHGLAISFLLMNWCKLKSINENRVIELAFKDKTVLNKRLNSPDVFKIVMDENKDIKDINNISFEDLPYMDFKKYEA